jgi:hypothetical protein
MSEKSSTILILKSIPRTSHSLEIGNLQIQRDKVFKMKKARSLETHLRNAKNQVFDAFGHVSFPPMSRKTIMVKIVIVDEGCGANRNGRVREGRDRKYDSIEVG